MLTTSTSIYDVSSQPTYTYIFLVNYRYDSNAQLPKFVMEKLQVLPLVMEHLGTNLKM